MPALPAQSGGFDHPHHEEVVALGVEDVEVELRRVRARRPGQVVAVEEGVVELVAGGQQQHVVLRALAVAEGDPAALDRGDVAACGDVAVPEVVQHERVHDRVRLVEPVVGVGQAVVAGPADEAADERAVDALLDRPRQPQLAAEGVDGPAGDELGQEVVAAAHAQVDARGVVHRVDRDVGARVAAAHNQHPLAGEHRRRAVLRGVQHGAGELAGQLRQPRRVQGAGGDQEALEDAGALLAVALGDQLPAGLVRAGRDHPGAELVVRAEVEALGVGGQVVAHLAVVGVRRARGVHRVLGELGHVPRGDQVRGVVHRRVRVLDVPQPADVGVQLEAGHRQPGPGQRPHAGQPHRSGTHHGVPVRLHHPLLPGAATAP